MRQIIFVRIASILYYQGITEMDPTVQVMETELQLDKIVGCNALKKEEFVDNVIVVWCAKSPGSQNVSIGGSDQHATVLRYHQWVSY